MRAQWLRREGARELVVVVTGWALGAAPFRHLDGDRDILVLSDWRALAPLSLPAGYAAADLVAWSFGVGAACRLPGPDPFRRRVAVCGSWLPCDDDLGIPRARVAATAAGLTEASLRKFARRAGAPLEGSADLEALRAELAAVMAWDAVVPPRFDRILLGASDRIFPLRNLLRAWNGRQDRTRILDCGHNPFAAMRDWDEVLA
ncbi:biotin synthesis protein BioG [Paracoccus aminovorans]|uniref:Biotin synthesis protein BioG n=1 Tax=Paracoccus aminovorans TaxID=34004 RepID=A0A1I2Z3A9_9RHOB|nr:pimeloyl-ACP methyl esterase BioG family protein [Paracoccus aminovorans]CQR83953.1 hypothetical protein JCM7685_pAMV3p0008 [Paracoccus aminovorans]SFH32357.1 biotin synthesis protein BioG [Paracoccus aminovorans]